MTTKSGGVSSAITAAIPSTVLGGPVRTGTEVILRLRAAQGDLTEAKLRSTMTVPTSNPSCR